MNGQWYSEKNKKSEIYAQNQKHHADGEIFTFRKYQKKHPLYFENFQFISLVKFLLE